MLESVPWLVVGAVSILVYQLAHTYKWHYQRLPWWWFVMLFLVCMLVELWLNNKFGQYAIQSLIDAVDDFEFP